MASQKTLEKSSSVWVDAGKLTQFPTAPTPEKKCAFTPANEPARFMVFASWPGFLNRYLRECTTIRILVSLSLSLEGLSVTTQVSPIWEDAFNGKPCSLFKSFDLGRLVSLSLSSVDTVSFAKDHSQT